MLGSFLQASHDVLPPGAHAAFKAHAGTFQQQPSTASLDLFVPSSQSQVPVDVDAIESSSSSVSNLDNGTIPTIRNTKSFKRWYWNPGALISDSWEVPQVEKYNAVAFLTLRSLFRTTGTVISNMHLWIEQLWLLMLFLVTFFAVLGLQYSSWDGPGGMLVPTKEKEEDILEFCEKMSTMASFMLSFFTQLNVERWWRLRTEGIGGITTASAALSWHVSQILTNDEHVLNTIRRYARTALMLVFMQERGYGDQFNILMNRGLITPDEMRAMKQVTCSHAEVMWVWVEEIILSFKKSGVIQSDFMLAFFLEFVQKGRDGTAVLLGQLATPIPIQYIHFIGFLVKLHNISVIFLMACVLAGHAYAHSEVMWLGMLSRTVVFPLLYDAILLLNEELMNPFSGNLLDFPMQSFDRHMQNDGLGYEDAARHVPSWIASWSKENCDANRYRPAAVAVGPAAPTHGAAPTETLGTPLLERMDSGASGPASMSFMAAPPRLDGRH